MFEIIITVIIAGLAGIIIFKSLRNSSKGKCNCGCSGCKAKSICSDEDNKTN